MDYKVLFKNENAEVKERYELVISGIKSNILNCDTEGKKKVICDYFRYVAKLVDKINSVYEEINNGDFEDAKKALVEAGYKPENYGDEILKQWMFDECR